MSATRVSQSGKVNRYSSKCKDRENKDQDRDEEIAIKEHKKLLDLKSESISGSNQTILESLSQDGKLKSSDTPFPQIKTEDNSTMLPKYSAVLERGKEELGMDELDTLQLELESLLSIVSQRSKRFFAAVESLDTVEDKRDRRGKLNYKTPQPSAKKRRTDERHSKAFKERSSLSKAPQSNPKLAKFKDTTPAASSSVNPSCRLNSSCRSQNIPNNMEMLPLDAPKLPAIKNDTPFKFWLSTEPYCGPITANDIDCLQSQIEKHEQPLPPVPDLGLHYAVRWAVEDILAEQNASNPVATKQKKGDVCLNVSSQIAMMLKKSDRLINESSGSLSQRLMASLLDAPTTIPNFDPKFSSCENTSFCNVLKNGLQRGGSFCKQFIELGILDEDDFTKPSPNDEILDEIIHIQAELNAVNADNVHKLKNLHSTASIELKKNELRKRITKIDNEILVSHKKMVMAKQKKKPFGSKKREDLLNLIKEQISLNEELNLIPDSVLEFI